MWHILMTAVNAVVPIILLIGLGYLLRQWGVLSDLFATYRQSWEEANPQLSADDVEFLTPKSEQGDMGGYSAPAAPAPAAPRPAANTAAYGSQPQGGGFVQVDEEELPF